MKFRPMMPVRFKRFYREFRDKSFCLLDVGCGNSSATQTIKWFPRCRYFGVDRISPDGRELACMERFFPIDLSREGLAAIPERGFDVILFSHCIEHLPNGLEVLNGLCGKLAPGGRIYIEFPSERSLRLPHMKGTLNFHDDPTHVRLYTLDEVAAAVRACGLEILRAGRRRDWATILLSPIHQLHHLLKHRRISAAALWDLLGFADYVYARRQVLTGHCPRHP